MDLAGIGLGATEPAPAALQQPAPAPRDVEGPLPATGPIPVRSSSTLAGELAEAEAREVAQAVRDTHHIGVSLLAEHSRYESERLPNGAIRCIQTLNAR